MRKVVWSWLGVLSCWFLWSACQVPRETVHPDDKLHQLNHEQAILRTTVELQLCGVHIPLWIRKIEDQCRSYATDNHLSGTPPCPPNEIRPGAMNAEDQGGGKLGKLIERLPHTVLRLRSTDVGTESLTPFQMANLNALLPRPFPAHMRLLLVTSPGPGTNLEVPTERIRWTQRLLRKGDVADEYFLMPWIWDFKLTEAELPKEDQRVGLEADEPSSRVWLYRFDCLALTEPQRAKK